MRCMEGIVTEDLIDSMATTFWSSSLMPIGDRRRLQNSLRMVVFYLRDKGHHEAADELEQFTS